MKLYLEVKADTNDADYVTERTEISQEELDEYMPLIQAIRNCKEYCNWNVHEYRRSDKESPKEMYSEINEDLIWAFNDCFVPRGENGVHSIEDIRLIEIASEKSLLRD